MKLKITQRKPDVSEDESSYSTSISPGSFSNQNCSVVGYGFTQANADTQAIENFLTQAFKEVIPKKRIMNKDNPQYVLGWNAYFYQLKKNIKDYLEEK